MSRGRYRGHSGWDGARVSGGEGGLLFAPVPGMGLLQQTLRIHLHEGSHGPVPPWQAAGTGQDGRGGVAQEAEVERGSGPDDGGA